MARARNIKPSLFKNEDLGTKDPFLTILFTGLWCLADREGRLEDRPARINVEVFPYRRFSFDKINGYLTVLVSLGLIDRYEVDGVKVIQVVKFSEHQSPHNTEKASKLPPKPAVNKQVTEITVNAPLNNGELTQAKRSDSLIPDSLIPDSGTENVAIATTAAASPFRAKSTGTRVPDPFPITPEMWAWLAEHLPGLENVHEVHADWHEYWSNLTTAKAVKVNWMLTWQKGMRKAKQWQDEKRNGKPTTEREKSAQRGSNAVAAIAELRRQAQLEQEQALSGRGNGIGPANIIAIESAEPH